MYDRAAICTRGSGAMLNFPRDQYDDDDLPNGWVASEKQFAVCLKQIQEECRLLVFQVSIQLYNSILRTHPHATDMPHHCRSARSIFHVPNTARPH